MGQTHGRKEEEQEEHGQTRLAIRLSVLSLFCLPVCHPLGDTHSPLCPLLPCCLAKHSRSHGQDRRQLPRGVAWHGRRMAERVRVSIMREWEGGVKPGKRHKTDPCKKEIGRNGLGTSKVSGQALIIEVIKIKPIFVTLCCSTLILS